MYRIMIVEDEYLLRSELSLCVDWAGVGFAPPVIAEDGEQGLAMAMAQPPDLVLTDIRMPKMDGLTMIGKMHKQGIKSLFVILSGYDDFSYAVEALRYGVIDYLLKPVDEKRLASVLQNAVERLNESRQVQEGQEALEAGKGNLYLQKATAYLQEHYAQDVHLSDLAQELFISDAYLGRLFIRHYHMKFTDYLHQLRIQNAVPLLRDPKWKLYQIAQKMGYNNQQYFCNVFKKMMGVSPQQFRHSLGMKMPDDEEKEEIS